ncbi:MAG: hypothetical protein EAX96_06450 [Candidatus Lokiarchaeota archaeon]|nr:hypothetical protein [Candidatus Lokiarchaeota archaeon]
MNKKGKLIIKTIEELPTPFLRLIWNSSILVDIHGKKERDEMLSYMHDANMDVEMINDTFLSENWPGFY